MLESAQSRPINAHDIDHDGGNVPAIACDTQHKLGRLLSPRSIAVIGASDRPGNLGAGAIAHLQRFGYSGKVYPVNPRLQSLHGLHCYASVSALPEPADMALFALSGEKLLDAIRECATAGIHAGIAWAGGFAEAGAAGQALQAELTNVCRDNSFSLCGPNCIGIINNQEAMTATFGSSLLGLACLTPGHISMVSQSGGIASFAHALGEQAGTGFRIMISTGNEVVVTTADFIEELADDPLTRVICVYIEGMSDGPRFIAALARARRQGKQVVVIKAGATPASASAALAHTGALAGEDRVWDAVLRECGAIRAGSLEEMIDIALYLDGGRSTNVPSKPGMAVLSFGGGGGVLAVDQGAAFGLATPPLSPAVCEQLRPLVPPIASIANPFDLTPDTYNKPEWFALFPEAIRKVASDPAIGILFFQLGAIAHKADDIIDVIIDIAHEVDQAVCVSWPLPPPTVLERLPRAGIHVFTDPSRGLRVMGKLLAAASTESHTASVTSAHGMDKAWALLPTSTRPGRIVSEDVCHSIMSDAGLAVAHGRLCVDLPAAQAAAAQFGFPLAMKGLSSAVAHKAAAGLVELGITHTQALADAFKRITLRAAATGTELDGLYVQQMVDSRAELIVAGFRDPIFGVMVSCGAGGAMTEALNDVVLHRAPIDIQTATMLLSRLDIIRRLRSHDALSLEHPAEFLARFSKLVAAAPLEDFVFEVNPIRWNSRGVVAVDGLLNVGDLKFGS